jgi:hypothetical protein
VEIAGLIGAGELRLDISEPALLADAPGIHQRAGTRELRGRVVLTREG